VIALENCHPFQRELWGRYWIFAHNGNLEGFEPPVDGFLPVGQTDSERAFCLIMSQLRDRFPQGHPGNEALFRALGEISCAIAAHGLFNFLLSNGEVLFAHCSDNLHYLVRRAPFGPAHLIDQDLSMDFSQVAQADDQVAVIASFPLTDNEPWTAMPPGQLLMFSEGEPLAALQCRSGSPPARPAGSRAET
jgi:glutamine amidotransferase